MNNQNRISTHSTRDPPATTASSAPVSDIRPATVVVIVATTITSSTKFEPAPTSTPATASTPSVPTNAVAADRPWVVPDDRASSSPTSSAE